MATNRLRETALAAIEATRFVPPQGKTRLAAMIAQRPDWCISRQRAWGVPITVFVHKESGEPLCDQKVIDRIAEAVEREGVDTWFSAPPERFLAPDHRAADYEPVTDIVDVWFESGASHSFVLEKRPELAWPADLYLEGSDQHRGWFHSSLLESCGTRGRAPYEAVLTHGFVLDELGRKMSKSFGNVVAPQDVMTKYGADILRLWVVASDYSEDLKIGPEILKHHAEAYRRIRNTLRWMLGNLDGFTESERLPVAEMPELERWLHHRLYELDRLVRRACEEFDFHTIHTELHNFCSVDLSAFYFDVRKDAIYCDRLDAPRRRAARTALDHAFDCLCHWLAPILCFTAEEAWRHRTGDVGASIHLRLFPEVPEAWGDEALAAKWDQVRAVRRVVTGALELERGRAFQGANLQARPIVHLDPEVVAALERVDLAEIAITSGIEIVRGPAPAGAYTDDAVPGVAVVARPAEGTKCERCWKVLPEVGHHAAHPTLCRRCVDAVEALAVPAD
jgi:isoleucyl-tRNA synthetase